jgi:hypothetical protein
MAAVFSGRHTFLLDTQYEIWRLPLKSEAASLNLAQKPEFIALTWALQLTAGV